MGIDLGRFKSKQNDKWVDWLADDPVPPTIRQKIRSNAVDQASRPVVRRPGDKVSTDPKVVIASEKQSAITVNITIPKVALKKPSIQLPKQVRENRRVFVGLVAVIIIVGAITASILLRGSLTGSDDGNPEVLSQKVEKADFEYSLPKGKTEDVSGDVRFDSTKKVVNFQDTIGGVPITISQQKLPNGFEDDTDSKVKKLAEDFAATKTIATANPTSYIGTDEKGPQTVIFAKKGLLVFIASTKEIDDHDWAEYITSLK